MAAHCMIDGCLKNTHGARLCPMHAKRKRLYGDPLYVNPEVTPQGAAQEFFANAILQETDECILWPFFVAPLTGYGEINRRGRPRRVHREVCIEVKGNPPSRKHETAHSCNVRRCINKRHLRWATREQNQADRIIHGTSNRGTRQWTHKLTEEQVKEIKSLPHANSNSVGPQYGVAPRTVRDIWNGATWAWL